MDLKNSQTYDNLMSAFAGESQARNKYTYYAEKARQDGYEQMAEIFEETAKNEMAHAKLWFELIKDGIGETKVNLEDAAAGENFEWTSMYADYAAKAKEEGFTQIAALFELVGKIEKEHEERFRKLISNIEGVAVFSKDGDAVWICSNCGFIKIGKEAPSVCPVCQKPRGYFKEKCENY